MTDGEKMYREDAERFVWLVQSLPQSVGFVFTRQVSPEGSPAIVNPYTCEISMPEADPPHEGNRSAPLHKAHGATMFEALCRALADAYTQRGLNFRMWATPRAPE